RRPTRASPDGRSWSTRTEAWLPTAADASPARTRPRWIAPRPTWRATSRRTSSRRASRTGSRSRLRTRSAPRTRSRSRSTRLGRSRWTPPGSWIWCGRRSTSARRRSSGRSTFSGRSTRTRPPTATSAARSSPGRRPTAPTSSAARSSSLTGPAPAGPTLSGPVDVCVDRPVLSLDRPFTYDLPEELGAGVGSLVRVPFHGGLVRGWVLGPAERVPPRTLKVRRAVTPVRFFDEPTLELLRWVSERYVAPLAAVIARSHPPRVAAVEEALFGGEGE